MWSRSILFETEHLIVVSQMAHSDICFVTFNELFFQANGAHFWGDGLFEKLDVTAIGVVSKKPNWYPHEDMKFAVAKIRSLVKGLRVVTYGHSQGGYGALKYSRALDAFAALSFCPQWSINPDDVAHFDKRYLEYYDPLLQGGGKINGADIIDNAYIVFDQSDREDARHAQELTKISNVRTVQIPFSGHETVCLAPEAGCASKLISLFFREKSDYSRDIRNILRLSRRSSQTYRKYLNLYLEERRRQTASPSCVAPQLRVSTSAQPSRPVAERVEPTGELAQAVAAGDIESARALISAATFSQLRQAGMDSLLRFCRDKALVQAELHLARAIIACRTDDLGLRLQALDTFVHHRYRFEARKELSEIVARFGAQARTKAIIDYARMLGTPELADGDLSSPSRKAI